MLYRPHIDGLRAIAVLAVVLFHAKVPPLTGGFVGVDIFFVISGFLITSVIFSEISEGRFSIVSFYERRARRILPALFAMLILSWMFAAIFFLPDEFSLFGSSLVATLLFFSNIFFWSQSAYFAATAETSPLLHTWSLSIEEQFYLFYPLLLLIFARHARGYMTAAIAALAVCSFVTSIWLTHAFPEIAFYFAPTRFWELLVGSLLALKMFPAPTASWSREGAAILGSILLCWGIVGFSPSTPFPGIAALLPCIGCALVIYAGESGKTIVTRALSLPSITFVGLISYSLYLWHWPFLVFARSLAFRPLTASETVTLLVSIFAMAAISWRLIEFPIRARSTLRPRQRIFAGSFGAAAALVLLGVVAQMNGGWPERWPARLAGIVTPAASMINPDRHECFARRILPHEVAAAELCQLGRSGAEPSFVLWGDSHAETLRYTVGELAERAGQNGYFAGYPLCPPATSLDARNQICQAFNEAVLKLVQERNIRLVILHARWDAYIGGTSSKKDKAIVERLQEQLISAIQALSQEGRRVVIIAGVPRTFINVPRAVALRERFGRDLRIEFSRADYDRVNEGAVALFGKISEKGLATVIYPKSIFCPEKTCRIVVDGHPLYSDNNHLTRYGAEFLKPALEPVFKTAVSPGAAPSDR